MDKLQKLADLAKQGSSVMLEVGAVVSELRAEGFTMVELEAASGMSRRMLYLSKQAADYVAAAGFSNQTAIDIGFTKMLVLSDNVPAAEALEWALKVQAMSVAQLKAQFTDDGLNLMQLKLHDKDEAYVEAALLRYGANRRGRGLANKEDALLRILGRLEQLEDLTPQTLSA